MYIRRSKLILFRPVGWLALAALLFQLLLPLAHPRMMVALADGPLWHHCGMADSAPAKGHQDQTPKAPSCPICQAGHILGNGFLPQNLITVAVSRLDTTIIVFPLTTSIAQQWVSAHTRSRAPPLFS